MIQSITKKNNDISLKRKYHRAKKRFLFFFIIAFLSRIRMCFVSRCVSVLRKRGVVHNVSDRSRLHAKSVDKSTPWRKLIFLFQSVLSSKKTQSNCWNRVWFQLMDAPPRQHPDQLDENLIALTYHESDRIQFEKLVPLWI